MQVNALENSVFEIPNYCNFHDLYYKMAQYFPGDAHFVEIGAWLGHSAAHMASRIAAEQKQIKFDVIDLWKLGEWSDTPHFEVMEKVVGHPVESGFDFFPVVQQNLKKCGLLIGTEFPNAGNFDVNLLQQGSIETSFQYADESLDFVFIDAGHTYEAVMKDIAHWWRKVKPGGILAGDDYNWATVAAAVRDFAQIRQNQALITMRNSWLVAKDDMRVVADRLVNLGVPGDAE